LALANSIAVTLEMAALLILLRKPLGGLATAGFGQSLAKMAIATGVMVLALGLVMPFVPGHKSWLGGAVGIAVGGVVYFGVAYMIGVEELHRVRRKVVQRLFKP
jgi:peptidoglycan biosynthesis protein MviN/MurJ (putative lipid II flippase)